MFCYIISLDLYRISLLSLCLLWKIHNCVVTNVWRSWHRQLCQSINKAECFPMSSAKLIYAEPTVHSNLYHIYTFSNEVCFCLYFAELCVNVCYFINLFMKLTYLFSVWMHNLITYYYCFKFLSVILNFVPTSKRKINLYKTCCYFHTFIHIHYCYM